MSTVPYIPDNAPFSEDQRAWLNGFLAGLYSEAPGGVATASAPAVPVTILYGSQTGTSEALSKQAAKQMKAANCEPKVLDMGDVSLDELAALENVLIITSTYGEGEAPDNAMSLHEALMADSAPSMAGVKYSVLGLATPRIRISASAVRISIVVWRPWVRSGWPRPLRWMATRMTCFRSGLNRFKEPLVMPAQHLQWWRRLKQWRAAIQRRIHMRRSC